MENAYQLKNQYLTVTLAALGAEITSIKDPEETEYIWNADAKYWRRHAPILFPMVGNIKEGKYQVKGKEYTIPAHGFARDSEFEVEAEDQTSITFILKSSSYTKSMYPFDFYLKIIYTLKDNTLDVAYHVINQNNDTMYFKIGAHPGFMCPLFKNESMEDYYLEFEKEEKATQLFVTPEVYLKEKTSLFEGKRIPLTKELFKDVVLIFKDYQSQRIVMGSKNHDKKITVAFEDFPFLGIWSTTNEAPFICIEPWFGHADYENDAKELENKMDIISLEAQNTFKCLHSITIS